VVIGVGTSATAQYAAGPVGAGVGDGLGVGASVGVLVGAALGVGVAVVVEAADGDVTGVGDGATAAPPHEDARMSATISARA
jgi:hypothetical protein